MRSRLLHNSGIRRQSPEARDLLKMTRTVDMVYGQVGDSTLLYATQGDLWRVTTETTLRVDMPHYAPTVLRTWHTRILTAGNLDIRVTNQAPSSGLHERGGTVMSNN